VKILRYFLWTAVAAAAGICLGAVLLHRGEHINSLWLVLAAACSYATAYRFYGKLYCWQRCLHASGQAP
jgi:carbon starvation protein